jgi:hypothetical protein
MARLWPATWPRYSPRSKRAPPRQVVGITTNSVRADEIGMSTTKEKVCDCCGKPLDADAVVAVVHADGAELVRHRECQMLELLERA